MTIKSFARAVSVATLLVIPAFAGVASAHETATQYPVPAAAFEAKIDARLARIQTRMQERIAKNNVPADRAAEMNARFAAKTAAVKAEVAKVTADGTVTQEEAKEVRAIVKPHGRHHRHGRGGAQGAQGAPRGDGKPSGDR